MKREGQRLISNVYRIRGPHAELNKLFNQRSADRRSPRCYCVSMDEDREYDVEADEEDTEHVFTTLRLDSSLYWSNCIC